MEPPVCSRACTREAGTEGEGREEGLQVTEPSENMWISQFVRGAAAQVWVLSTQPLEWLPRSGRAPGYTGVSGRCWVSLKAGPASAGGELGPGVLQPSSGYTCRPA